MKMNPCPCQGCQKGRDVAILIRRHIDICFDTSITYVKIDVGNFFLIFKHPLLQMVIENGFLVAPFYGDQNFWITIEWRHVICFWKALNPHHWMAIENIWSPYLMMTKFFFKCYKV